MIRNEVFDYLVNELTGTASRAVRSDYQRKRYNRALLALKCQNYFLSTSFTNTTGAANVTGVAQTQALEKPLIIRGGGINAAIVIQDLLAGGAINVQVFRSGSSRAQMSLNQLRASHYFSAGESQKWALDWPVPWLLAPNEAIQVRFTQAVAVNAGQIYNVGFYGLAVDPNFRCSDALIESIREQIRTTVQYPRYIHLKTDLGAGTIVFPAIAADQRAIANTIEVPAHLLILGFRRYGIDVKDTTASKGINSTMRLVVTGGAAFSRIELPCNAYENFCTPDAGYFRFMVPHFIPKGSSLSLSILSTISNLEEQNSGEIELLCVSV